MVTRFHVESPASHRLSQPPLSIESPASRRKMWVLRKAILTRGDRPLLYHKLALSNAWWHAKNHNDLCPVTWSKAALFEVGFSAVAILGGGWLQSPASDGPPWIEYKQNRVAQTSDYLETKFMFFKSLCNCIYLY